MKVKDILAHKSAKVISIPPQHTLHAASQLLAEHNIGALLVVDDAGMPVGILSERDIVRTLATHGAAALDFAVERVMTKDLIIALPDDKLASLSTTMTEKHIRHLPVMHEQHVLGMVSIGDVVKAQLDHVEGEARILQQYIQGGHA
jgi:CBS domain-containing protein